MCSLLLLLLLLVVHVHVYVEISSCESVNLSLVVVRCLGRFSRISCHRCLLHSDALLFPESHQVLLLGLFNNTYLYHVVLIDVHIIIKSNVEKVVRIVTLKDIDSFVDEAILGLVVMIVIAVFLIVILTRRTLVSTTSVVIWLLFKGVFLVIATAGTARGSHLRAVGAVETGVVLVGLTRIVIGRMDNTATWLIGIGMKI